MGLPFFAGLAWLFIAGAACLLTAGLLKQTALVLLARAFGVAFSPALYAALTLPGFFLHEGAHALSAFLLRVPIHRVTFIPRRAAGDLGVSAGTEVARSDPLRMALIALAPLLAGTAALALLTGVLGEAGSDPRPWVRLPAWLAGLDWHTARFWIATYLLWSISTHMAPSPTDMRFVQGGAAGLLVLLVLAGLVLTVVGTDLLGRLGGLLGRLGDGLAVGTVLNGVMLLPIGLLSYLLRR